mmetsp:Transcript_50362/g.113204  ORF Transcript_50362/g.113204 Transcript_50362/m.113204 type:complete len:576 (+) Transcript_50362:146-1873(+)
MGESCSKAESGVDKYKISSRASFSSLKKSDKRDAILKNGNGYLQGYLIGDLVGKDNLVVTATCKENEVDYVARALEKQYMPFKDMSGVEEYLQTLSGLDHIHICRFIEAFDCDDRIKMIYEKAKPVSIFEEEEDLRAGKPLSQDLVTVYCRQIAMALSVAHKQGIVHGRLSDSSILADEACGTEEEDSRSVKICDMGQTLILRPARSGSSITFEAPENIWEELPAGISPVQLRAQIKVYQSIDLWSLGVILYKMLTGNVPFAGKDDDDTKELIKSSIVSFGPEWENMKEAKEVVAGLLKHSGRIRMTADKILKHPWIMLSKVRVSRSKMMRVLQNVIFNTTESTFKKFAMRVIAEEMPAEKLEIVTKAFRLIDKNGDGTLEVEEIRAVLRKYGEEEGAADEIFEAIDRDASGTLNFAEFTAVSIGPSEYCNKETLWHTFNRFDKDGNGQFDKTEIMTVVREVEHLSDVALLEKEVEEIAKNVEMPVDFDTFVHIVVTPAGQQVNKVSTAMDRFCYNVLKVDNHKVRHIAPKQYDSTGKAANPLLKSPYSKIGDATMSAETPTAARRSARKSSLVG